MSSIQQTIYNALYKVSTPGAVEKEYATPEEARAEFIAMVMAELFPPETKGVKKAKAESPKVKKAEAPVEVPKAVEESPKKKGRGPMTEEAKAAMAAKRAATLAAKKGGVEAVTEQLAQMTVEEDPTPAQVAAGGGKPSPKKPAKSKASPKKEEKPKAEVNLAKIDPTWRKLLKEADKDKAKEREPLLLAHLNAMSNAAFNGKGAKEHVAEFVATLTAPPAPAVVEMVDASLEELEFQGKTYYVNPETKRVYEGELDEEGALKVTRPVGYVGMADFKEMSLE